MEISHYIARTAIYEGRSTGANIAPLLARAFGDVRDAEANPNGYWLAAPSSCIESGEGGWAHVELDNSSGSSVLRAAFVQASAPSGWCGSGEATLRLEVGSLETDAGEAELWIEAPATAVAGESPCLSGDAAYITGSGEVRMALSVNEQGGFMIGTAFAIAKGRKASFDARASIYQNGRTGGFEAYEEG